MSTMQIKVVNQSKHDFEFIDQFGTSINDIKYIDKQGTKSIDPKFSVPIPAHSTKSIGYIELPSQLHRSGNRGWWYVQDKKNQAVFELYAFVDPDSHSSDKVSAGLKANCSHDTNDPTPNPVPNYLECSKNDQSFTFTIKSSWTDRDSSPKYVFNFGHYAIKKDIPKTGTDIYATHAYVVVRKFDGTETVSFKCWGAAPTEPPYSDPDVHYPALTFLGGEYELTLARTISCFDPDDPRSDYDRHPSSELARFVAIGKLGLGDCSGIVYGETGVCHQMANRICKAVTDFDVGNRADMTLYNLTHTAYGQYGGKPDKTTPSWITDQIEQRFFGDFITVEEFEKLKEKFEDQKEGDTDYLFKPWEDYFAECKKLVKAAYYYKTTPLVALEVRYGDVIDAVTPVFAKQVKGDRCGGAGGQETRLEKAGYVITGMDIYRGRYLGKPVIAQIQVIWHRLTPSGIDSTDEIISAKVGSGTDVEGLALNKLRTSAGKFISQLSANTIAVDGRTFLADIDIEQEAGIASFHESPPLVGLEVRHGYVIDAITPIFTETVKGCQYGGTGGNAALLEKAGYVITGIDVWRGRYFGKKVIAQLQVIWHKLTPVGIDSAHEIISNKLGSGNNVTDLQCEKLRAGPGNYIRKLDADGSPFLEDIWVTREKLI
ncbi:MAG: hypothetical protein R3E79_34680 [Caldilineaceae bacterium]